MKNFFNMRRRLEEPIEQGQLVHNLEKGIQHLKKQINNIKLAYVGKIVDLSIDEVESPFTNEILEVPLPSRFKMP